MTRPVVMILCAALAIMAVCAGFLGSWRTRQAMGVPGVRVVNEPLYGVEDLLGNTNTFLAGEKSIYLPERVLDYESRTVPLTRQVLNWLPADTTYGQRQYRRTNGFTIQTTAVLMGKDRTSIHQPQYCLSGQGWTRTAQELMTIPIARPDRYDLPVMRLKLHQSFKDREGREQALSGIFVYWFVADNQLTARHGEMNWWMARDLLRTAVLQRWAYVTVFSVCAPGAEEATYAQMAEFIAAAVPEFQLATGARNIQLSSRRTEQ